MSNFQIFLIRFSKLLSVDVVMLDFESPNLHTHTVSDRVLNAPSQCCTNFPFKTIALPNGIDLHFVLCGDRVEKS